MPAMGHALVGIMSWYETIENLKFTWKDKTAVYNVIRD